MNKVVIDVLCGPFFQTVVERMIVEKQDMLPIIQNELENGNSVMLKNDNGRFISFDIKEK